MQLAPNFLNASPEHTKVLFSKAAFQETRKCPLGVQFSVPNAQF